MPLPGTRALKTKLKISLACYLLFYAFLYGPLTVLKYSAATCLAGCILLGLLRIPAIWEWCIRHVWPRILRALHNVNDARDVQIVFIPPRLARALFVRLQAMAQKLVTTGRRYSYAPLVGDRQIRLLYLHPGEGTQPLAADLVHASLDERAGQFESLSYVWGSGHKTRILLITDSSGAIRKLLIGAALHAALQRIRLPTTVRVLWADAVCINQADNLEKAAQVNMMGDVYAMAARTLAYLGPTADGSNMVLDLLEKIARNSPALSGFNLRTVDQQVLGEVAGLPPDHDPVWDALRKFWARPWFRRVWVIQEFVRAPDVRIICGDWEASWALLYAATRNTDLSIRIVPTEQNAPGMAHFMSGASAMHFMNQLRSRCLSHTVHRLGLGPDRVLNMDPLTLEFDEQQRFNLVRALNPMLRLDGDAGSDFLDLLSKADSAEATRARDHLFALRGLASDAHDDALFRPDYVAPFEEIVLRYGQAFVRRGEGMELLYQARLGIQSCRFPSWIPDWTTKYMVLNPDDTTEYTSLGQSCRKIFSASGSPSTITLDPTNPTAILTRGRSLGDLIFVDANHISHGWIHGFLLHIRTACYFANRLSHLSASTSRPGPDVKNYPPTKESFTVAIAKILIANQTANHEIAPAEFTASLVTFAPDLISMTLFSKLFNLPEQELKAFLVGKLTYALYDQIYKFFKHFRLGMTSCGLLCLVPHAARMGDSVFVLHGGAVPFVLTRRQQTPGWRWRGWSFSGKEKEKGNLAQGREGKEMIRDYRLVGECYVHGAMNGETATWGFLPEEEEVGIY